MTTVAAAAIFNHHLPPLLSTQVEDRPIVRERVERIVEHRPVQKEYITEVR